MQFWNFSVRAAAGEQPETVELRIAGDIISDDDVWFYEWLGIPCTSPNAFKAELAQYAGKPIDVWIDSYGGDVFAAAGIYNALKEHSRKGGAVNVKIDGKAMSAASMIAMAGDKVEMSPVSVMMIHNPWMVVQGDSNTMRHEADVLDTIRDSILNAYQLKTGKSASKLREMMDDESWMSAKKAMKEGFADGILYSDNQQLEPVEATFNRRLVMASADASIKRLIAIKQETAPPPGPDTDLLKGKLALASAGRFFI